MSTVASLLGSGQPPLIFTAFTNLVAWVIYCRGVWWLLHYLDDFLFIGASGTSEASLAASSAAEVFAGTGIPVASLKTEGPSTSVTFLEIVVDTVQFQLRLSPEKVTRLQGLVVDWWHKCSCTCKELESFIGHLAHTATVICPGQIFLQNLFNLLSLVSRPYHYMRLTAPVRADLQWWLQFLQVWNGMLFFPPSRPSHHVYLDASGSHGCGAFDVSSSWFKGDVIHCPKGVCADCHCGGYMGATLARMSCVLPFQQHGCGLGVVKRAAKDTRMIHLLRILFFYVAIYKFHFSAEHIPGIRNTVADALSCNDITSFSCIFFSGGACGGSSCGAGCGGGGSPRLELAALDQAVQALFVQGLSPRTVSSYCSGIRRYVSFCLHLHLHPLPSHCVALCLVCTPNVYLILLSVLTSALSSSSKSLQGAQTWVWASCTTWCERWTICPLDPITLLGSQSLQTF